MKIHYKKNDIFIPEWNDNKKLPEGEQIKFHHRFLTTLERKQFIYVEEHTQGSVAKFASGYSEDMTEDEQVALLDKTDRKITQDGAGIARCVVTKIENLEMEDEAGKILKIDTIEKFYNAPDIFPALRAEVEGMCVLMSARADTKN